MLGDDLEAWLDESPMMKQAFKGCAVISGLIERRFPQQKKSGRQVTFSTDLVYDALRRHQPDHLLLRCARADAAEGMIDVARLGLMLKRISGRIVHAPLDHLSPFSVSIILEIGKQRSPGDAREMVLADAAEDLIAEASRVSSTFVFMGRPCGGLRLTLGPAQATCRVSGALWLDDERALVVADLHLEKGSAFARRGQMLPPYDTRETLRRLALEVADLEPRVVVFLGDSFHDHGGEDRLEADDRDRLARLARGRTLVWLAGNHDPAAPTSLPGETARTIRLGGLDFVHEPTGGTRLQVAGHLHPCAKVRGRGANVRRRCFVTDGERLILPAFGTYAGGLNVRDAAFAPFLSRPPLAAVLGSNKVHPIGWSRLERD